MNCPDPFGVLSFWCLGKKFLSSLFSRNVVLFFAEILNSFQVSLAEMYSYFAEMWSSFLDMKCSETCSVPSFRKQILVRFFGGIIGLFERNLGLFCGYKVLPVKRAPYTIKRAQYSIIRFVFTNKNKNKNKKQNKTKTV